MKISGYRVIQKEGEYEGLQIFRAVVEGGSRHVQIRVFPSVLNRFPLLMEQFRNTFTKLSQTQHPNICPIANLHTQDGLSFLVLPYIVAGNLADRFHSGFASALDASRVIDEISGALTSAHKRSILHGHLTAEHVLIDEDGHLKIVGFGEAAILRALPSSVSPRSRISSAIEPPEADRVSKMSPATDQFSLALIALRLLTGLSGIEALAALRKDLETLTYPNNRRQRLSLDLPPKVVKVLGRALEEKPSKRFGSVADFNHALQIALGVVKQPRAAASRVNRPVTKKQKPKRRRRAVALAPLLAGIAIIFVVGAVVAAGWFVSGVTLESPGLENVDSHSGIELPRESGEEDDLQENSSLARDPSTTSTSPPDGEGSGGKSSPTPTSADSVGQPQATQPPQATRSPSTNPTPTSTPFSTVTSTSSASETPAGSDPPTATATPTPTDSGPTDTPTPSSTPTLPPPTNTPPPPTVDPSKCNYNNEKSPHYCTPTP